MIDGGDHLWNCLRYIDLNMVRAGVICHPSEWPWCGYQELVGKRERFRLLEIDRLVDLLGLSDRESLAEIHGKRIVEAISAGRLNREKIWTESIAVGSEAFLREIALKNKIRKKLIMARTGDGSWCVREDHTRYTRSLHSEKGPKKSRQGLF
jgi:putative transposase